MNIQDLDQNRMPQHVAVIMDGNGRWAQQRLERRLFGHQNAITSVRQTVEAAAECGIKYLTLYAFSTENWNRQQEEVEGLMELLAKALVNELSTLQQNGVRLRTIGDIDRLPEATRLKLLSAIEQTASNKRITLVLALSYSARWEITEAVRSMASEVVAGQLSPEQIDESVISQHLATASIPDPDLLIRTSGELRISNFLLWQMAYTEFYFTDVLWPDFRKEHFFTAIADYQHRQRRFGMSGDQIAKSVDESTHKNNN